MAVQANCTHGPISMDIAPQGATPMQVCGYRYLLSNMLCQPP